MAIACSAACRLRIARYSIGSGIGASGGFRARELVIEILLEHLERARQALRPELREHAAERRALELDDAEPLCAGPPEDPGVATRHRGDERILDAPRAAPEPIGHPAAAAARGHGALRPELDQHQTLPAGGPAQLRAGGGRLPARGGGRRT